MSQIVPFDGGNVPAYLREFTTEVANDDLLSHASNSFPIISIKGKQFTISRDGEKHILPHPKAPDVPANSINVVIVKANKGTSKVFYMKGYEEGTSEKPDCFSNDGVRPDPSVEKPVSKACSTCPNNVWGSKISDTGQKLKLCSDSVRIAVSTPNAINDPYFMRVPAASIKHLGELGKQLEKRGVHYQMVVTKIEFDKEVATPRLLFTPVGYLSKEQYLEVQQVANGDVVQAIMGSGYGIDEDAGAPAQAEAAPAPAPEPAPAPAPKTKAKATPAPVATAEVEEAVEKAAAPAKPATIAGGFADVDIDNLDFDN